MNKFIWSLDISTTNIGCALWDVNGKLIELKHLELKLSKNIIVEDREIFKSEIFREYVESFKNRLESEYNGELVDIIVEEPLGGSVNPSTAALLFGFNGICRFILFKSFGILPVKISVHDSRKIFCPELIHVKYNKKGEKLETLSFPKEYIDRKKQYIWEKVAKLEPQIEWFYKKNKPDEIHEMCYDLSDSYCVGYAGLKRLGYINSSLNLKQNYT